MTPGKTVYVVTEGCYSDYRILAVFDDEAWAIEYVGPNEKKYVGPNEEKDDYSPRIEAYILNEPVLGIQGERRLFELDMTRNGNTDAVQQCHYAIDYRYPSFRLTWDNRLRALVYARDEKHAVKITNERRAMMIANGDWPETE